MTGVQTCALPIFPEPQQQRLDWLASWTARYGESLYGTRPWRRAEGETREGLPVRFTRRDDLVYAIVLGAPRRAELVLRDLEPQGSTSVRRLGGGELRWSRQGSDLRVELDSLPDEPAHAFALRGLA